MGAAPEEAVVVPDEDIVEPDDALPEISFDQLPSGLQEASALAGWSTLMPVQAKAIASIGALANCAAAPGRSRR